MQIVGDFIGDNQRIEIISNNGEPTPIPRSWRPVLGTESLLVAVPDMHMFLHNSTQDNFKYGAEAMIDFLRHVGQVRRDMSLFARRMQFVQLGDMFELRFPIPGSNQNPTADQITRSHFHYQYIVESMRSLDARFIVGNHDYEHRTQPGVLESASIGQVHLEHGFNADRWYHFANPEHSHWRPTMHVFKQLRRAEAWVHRARVAFGHLEEGRHAAAGVTSGINERHEYPSESKYPRHQLDYFHRLLTQSHEHARRTRICIIGHTHHPHIRTSFADGERMFVDAGCWTDGRSDFVVATNNEIAICRYKRIADPQRMAVGNRLSRPRTQYRPAVAM